MSDATAKPRAETSPGYQVFMLALSLFALGVVASRTLARFDRSTIVILDYVDWAVCAVFLADFLLNLRRASSASCGPWPRASG